METSLSSSSIVSYKNKKTDAAEFLIETRKLPTALRQVVFGMAQAAEIFNWEAREKPPDVLSK